MSGAISAFPLAWPIGWKRSVPASRRAAKFARKVEHRYGDGTVAGWKKSVDLTIAQARRRVLDELHRMGLSRDDIVISANLPLRLDGEPRSDAKEPTDPGVAVYWQESDGSRRVMAIDQYTRCADNLAAIAATLDAMRAIERHGGAVILERAFTGFVALPAPGQGAKREWPDVLGIPRNSTREAVKVAYRSLAARFHPDRPGGSHDAMAELNAAQDAALQECFA